MSDLINSSDDEVYSDRFRWLCAVMRNALEKAGYIETARELPRMPPPVNLRRQIPEEIRQQIEEKRIEWMSHLTKKGGKNMAKTKKSGGGKKC